MTIFFQIADKLVGKPIFIKITISTLLHGKLDSVGVWRGGGEVLVLDVGAVLADGGHAVRARHHKQAADAEAGVRISWQSRIRRQTFNIDLDQPRAHVLALD